MIEEFGFVVDEFKTSGNGVIRRLLEDVIIIFKDYETFDIVDFDLKWLIVPDAPKLRLRAGRKLQSP